LSSQRTRYPLNTSQQRTWLNYMRVFHRLEYEMNRQLLADVGLSLSDYTVMNALSQSRGRPQQLTALATTIGWERSRLSHHLQRMAVRGLIDRVRSQTDGRAIDVVLSDTGWDTLRAAAPLHAAWVRTLFFSDIDSRQEGQLADILAIIYENILREGALPSPDQI